jgi:hypothetical protein
VRYEDSFAVSSGTFTVVDKRPSAIAQLAGRNATFFIALAVLAGILYVAISSFIPWKGKDSAGKNRKAEKHGRGKSTKGKRK